MSPSCIWQPEWDVGRCNRMYNSIISSFPFRALNGVQSAGRCKATHFHSLHKWRSGGRWPKQRARARARLSRRNAVTWNA